MNERIEKLAEQAMVNAVSKNFTGEKLELRMPSEAWAKEFAELIIRQCGYYADVFAALGCPADMNPAETEPSDYIKKQMGVS